MTSLTDLLTTTTTTEMMSVGSFIICVISAMLMGIMLSFSIQFKSIVSKSFAVTIALLPPVVAVVIMMVNGSIGTGIAVAGTFSLIRFRSVPGTAREITAVFIAMAIGLASGIGYLVYALIFTIIAVAGLIILENTTFGETKQNQKHKIIRITIPEDLDYTEIFTDLFEDFTSSYKLTMVKTTNMGSMFKLSYDVILNDPYEEKEFIDQLRVRNGNLEVSCSIMSTTNSEL